MMVVEVTGAFLMGLMGSTHCVVMCGPLAALSCSRSPSEPHGSTGRGAFLTTQLGRLTTYGALGAVVGMFGGVLERAVVFSWLQISIRVLAGVVLVLTGLYLTGLVRKLRTGDRISGAITRAVRGAWDKTQRLGGLGRFVQGMLWGLMPCGLVYAGLALALTSGTWVGGAATMFAFGAGTLPALLGVTLTAGLFTSILRLPKVRLAAGLLMALAGTVQVSIASGQGSALLQAPAAEAAPLKPCCRARMAEHTDP